MFTYSSSELTRIDHQLHPLVERAGHQAVEAQQLALDATRLLSCTADRFEEYRSKGFFKRCWSALSGKTRAMNSANWQDLMDMQKVGWRYLKLLHDNDLILAHSMITIRNNLLTLAISSPTGTFRRSNTCRRLWAGSA